MAGVGVAVMIRRWFNDEVVVMETAGTGQGRSAGSIAGAASGGHHAISSALPRLSIHFFQQQALEQLL